MKILKSSKTPTKKLVYVAMTPKQSLQDATGQGGTNEIKKVYVAMSGGVDSSVAAALLKNLPAGRQGKKFNVVGVFMKPWSPKIKTSFCLWKNDREDAMKVAAKLNIPLLTWDFSKEYKKQVTDYMIREYKAGRTPNPDVMCNKEIKFGLFLKKALKEGADFIATGHYVRLKRTSKKLKVFKVHKELEKLYKLDELHNYHLLKAKDDNKDQSYFLWTLTQEQLKYCLFPIGDYTKPEVRKMAKKFGLPTAEKKDSQGVCFIGPLDMKGFLQKYIKPKRGDIILLDTAHSTRSARSGRVVEQHDGIYYYTIGQRHGLNITNGKGPYFVVRKDIKKNIIYVGSEKDLMQKGAKMSNLNWISGNIMPHFFRNKGHLLVDVKIRYRSKSEKAILSKNGSLKFKNLTRAITPGQSAVLYKGEELLGGGIIS